MFNFSGVDQIVQLKNKNLATESNKQVYFIFFFIANVIIGCHYCCRLYFSQLSKPSYWPISLKSSLIYLSLSTAYFYFAVTVECTLILQSTIENVRMYYNQEKGFKKTFSVLNSTKCNWHSGCYPWLCHKRCCVSQVTE